MRRFTPLLSLIVLLCIARQTRAQYTFTTLNYPGSVSSEANGINAAGQIVGDYTNADGNTHAFILNGTTYTSFDVPGAAGYSSATGSNATNQVVGLYQIASGATRAFIRNGGTYTDLIPFANSSLTQAFSINTAGHVVGSYRDASNNVHGFLYNGSAYSTLTPPGASDTTAIGINTAESIVGTDVVAGLRHGFLLSAGNYTSLDVAGASFTVAEGINDSGRIAGLYENPDNSFHGFVLNGGIYTPLNAPGATLTQAYAINNAGQLVGYFEDASGNGHGFLATPVPEPSIFGLVGLSLAVISGFRSRGRKSARLCALISASAIFAPLLPDAASADVLNMPAGQTSLQFVTVGNPGNAPDPITGSQFGAVPYAYRIGKYDVTNAQYAQFLNAKDPAGVNPLNLYNSNMAGSFGGIRFNSGNTSGSKYTLILSAQNHPVNNVTWYSAVRFANWLNNGQGNGDTETGAYALLHDGSPTPVPVPSNTSTITRSAAARVVLPSENEWYKAAYFDPRTTAQGGPPADGHYWLYPTSGNVIPTARTPTSTPNSANYDLATGNLSDVGAYTGTTTPCGAFDMAFNVWQWNESLLSNSGRGVRGDSIFNLAPGPLSSLPDAVGPEIELDGFGFRVASVPEPSLALVAILAPLAHRRPRPQKEVSEHTYRA